MVYLALLGFFTAFLLVYSMALARGKTAVVVRLEEVVRTDPGPTEAIDQPRAQGLTPTQFLRSLVRFVPLKGIGKRLESNLIQADIPLKGEEFAGILLVGFVGGGLIGLLVFMSLVHSVALAFAGVAVPMIWLHITKAKRIASFNTQLCDALAMTANTLRAGFSFLQALETVRKELPDPISKEFGKTLQDLNLGLSTEEALKAMVDRVRSDDLDLMVTAVIIQRQIGGNLAEILDKIAETIRERIRIKGEIKILTAQGRISGLVVGLLPVGLAMILLLINPEYIQDLFTTPTGQKMLAGAVVAEVIGLATVRQIMNIEV